MTTRLHLIALTLALAVPWHAMSAPGQWAWKDASGRITVSDLPPPRDIPAENILRRPKAAAAGVGSGVGPGNGSGNGPGNGPGNGSGVGPSTGPAGPTASAASTPLAAPRIDPELQARLDAAAKEKAAKARAEEAKVAQQRAENCRNARKHLAALDSGHRIARYNDKGEREILDDQQRATEARRAREVMAAECG